MHNYFALSSAGASSVASAAGASSVASAAGASSVASAAGASSTTGAFAASIAALRALFTSASAARRADLLAAAASFSD